MSTVPDPRDARDVAADVLLSIQFGHTVDEMKPLFPSRYIAQSAADSVLIALRAAGYRVVRQREAQLTVVYCSCPKDGWRDNPDHQCRIHGDRKTLWVDEVIS